MTINEFISAVQQGFPVMLINQAPANTNLTFRVGFTEVTLLSKLTTKTVDGSKNIGSTTTTIVSFVDIDLGKFFSAKEVLRSPQIRRMMAQGDMLAQSGTISLSKVPTI